MFSIFGVRGAGGGDDELKRRLDLGAIGGSGPELGRVEERFENGGDVATAGEPGLCHAIDEGRRWIVGDEADGKFGADEVSGGGTGGEHVEELAAFHLAVVLESFCRGLSWCRARGGWG